MLGGVDAVATASRDGSPFLECHLRPTDSLSHPLFGELVRTPTLLLRVRVKRPRPGVETPPMTTDGTMLPERQPGIEPPGMEPVSVDMAR